MAGRTQELGNVVWRSCSCFSSHIMATVTERSSVAIITTTAIISCITVTRMLTRYTKTASIYRTTDITAKTSITFIRSNRVVRTLPQRCPELRHFKRVPHRSYHPCTVVNTVVIVIQFCHSDYEYLRIWYCFVNTCEYCNVVVALGVARGIVIIRSLTPIARHHTIMSTCVIAGNAMPTKPFVPVLPLLRE